ncbi:hypothetical protein DSO57_1000483 [Entomophthora muscae]|uniref:Uncharacterized protein n=1 Tax=Entomophthora muscae TaxID=34485 RepID=A0ACC2UUV4_9FUNG|nr:hypothetical protein DSO57_1000483 [Entomophthora muscae]
MNLWFSQAIPYLLLALLHSQSNYSNPSLLAYHLPEADAQIALTYIGLLLTHDTASDPQPSCPQEHKTAADVISTQLFGVLYFTLTGLVDSMVPANSPWALLGQLFSYIVKLAPILYWALPLMTVGRPPTDQPKPTIG